MAVAKAGQQDLQSLVLSCNKDGMEGLRKGHYKAAFEQLKYAEAILIANQKEGENTSLLAVTCNNLGCYYKKVGKLHAALSYLRQALKVEVSLQTDDVTVAGTHLNICAILSKLEKHDKAVQHALCSLELISNRIAQSESSVLSDDYSVLAIAYHNVAVEREFLHQWDQAAMAYQKGFQVAKRCLGDQHPLTQTLGKNCDAVLQKSAKYTKDKSVVNRKLVKDPGSPTKLPPITATSPSGGDTTAPMPQGNQVMKEAVDWVADEESQWSSFARQVLHDQPLPPPPPMMGQDSTQVTQANASDMLEERGLPADALGVAQGSLAQGRLPQALQSLDLLKEFTVPTFKDADISDPEQQNLDREKALQKRMVMGKLDEHPEALMDLIDADRDSHQTRSPMRSAPNDYRPNRLIRGSTRTSLVLRRTGMFNSTAHRDQVISNNNQAQIAKPWKSQFIQKTAAERIQRCWRAWHRYCTEHQDWMTTTRICATMIQARWRSYHVRRQKLDKAAGVVQRHIRGCLVRLVLKRHTAAVTIQRHVVGMLTRKQLWRLNAAAIEMQRLVRGGQARRAVTDLYRELTRVVIILQRSCRGFIAKRRAAEQRNQRERERIFLQAVVDLQRFYRGWKGRLRSDARREEYQREYEMHRSATLLQSMARRDQATKRVNQIRRERLQLMNKSATFVRKLWLAHITRKRYLELKQEFNAHIDSIITMQRYVRGFLVRLRMWREAIKAEEELWSAVEIQRVWRGYLGRIRWEAQYEEMFKKEMAAHRVQKMIRGWLSRHRVNKIQRKLARGEFEKARGRFKAAQRIQALVRGVLVRKVIRAWRERIIHCVVNIQRVARGHHLRMKLWNHVRNQRATMIASMAKGYLVRKRLTNLVAKVIMIQRNYRAIKGRDSKDKRQARVDKMQQRKAAAKVIQDKYVKHLRDKHIAKIKTEQAAGDSV
eukprot:gnl/MRDRNA2_/MRDRNA2_88826_c0_seq1.p1 gnl/MRDRNA2_/MRDRNA2_88826_c0~~gnl/MRDRNA2_/MRDRNA2_88826_c0_seq1.p1  ORF type:complete len:940 (-),score=174.57 gnl/MRDRNA2_/MRDRNA2_88826_c0_seq1:7-2826(-)